MNAHLRARAGRGPLRITALACAALAAAAALLAGCSTSGQASPSSAGAAPKGAAQGLPAAQGLSAAPAHGAARKAAGARSTRLALATPNIIYTASLTVRAKDVFAAASRATAIAEAAGGYVSGENASVNPAHHARSAVTLQLKIPVARYQATLSALSARLGTQLSLRQQAKDVTQQVADVSSRVTSAHAAIAQLRALLKRTGTVSGLLGVQDQINAQESALEALQAQQRALARQTSYATVSLRLVSPRARHARKKKHKAEHGFVAGVTAGWRGLVAVVTWLLTALGAVLPFAAAAAAATGAGYAAWRRLRHRSRPKPAG